MEKERSIKYIVKPEIGLVVCIIRDDEFTSWRGSAKCSPDDTFNEDIGKKIAFLRACAKRKRSALQDIKLNLEWIDYDLKEIEERKARLLKKVNSIRVSLAKYSEEIYKLGIGIN